MAKATGMPNGLANLNPQETGLYDELVGNGNFDAALGLRHIGMIRSGMIIGTELADDPINTEISSKSIKDYFSHTIVDKSGVTKKHFDALVSYLDNRTAIPGLVYGQVDSGKNGVVG